MDAEGLASQDGYVSGIDAGTEVGGALEVSEDADELDEFNLCGIGVVGGRPRVGFQSDHEKVDEAANDLLILELGGFL
jgi:hypothetical protein